MMVLLLKTRYVFVVQKQFVLLIPHDSLFFLYNPVLILGKGLFVTCFFIAQFNAFVVYGERTQASTNLL